MDDAGEIDGDRVMPARAFALLRSHNGSQMSGGEREGEMDP